MLGTILKIKIFEFTNKKGEKGEIGTFTFHSNKTGYIDCKCFRQEDINDLKKLNDRDEIDILNWFPKKDSWVDKNGVKQYKVNLIVECFEIKKQQEQPQEQLEGDSNEIDWDKEFGDGN